MLDKNRNLVKDETGKVKYVPIIQITNRTRRDAFSRQVWNAFDQFQKTHES